MSTRRLALRAANDAAGLIRPSLRLAMNLVIDRLSKTYANGVRALMRWISWCDAWASALAIEPSTVNCAYNAHIKNSQALAQGKSSMKSRRRSNTPSTVKRTVPSGRLRNAEYRTREYLTEREVERLRR